MVERSCDRDVLCFIEVKTRTTRDLKPAEAAGDRDKQRTLAAVAATICATWHFRASGASTSFPCMMIALQPAIVRVISECLPRGVK